MTTLGPDDAAVAAAAADHRRIHRLHNPYEAFPNEPRAKPLHQLIYDLPTSPELLFPDEAAARGRNWGQTLTLYTGAGYLSGAVAGAAHGTLAGLRAAEHGDSVKIRLNRVLNAGGLAGRRLGNSVGVVSLIFAGLDRAICEYTDSERVLNTVAAGLGTGLLYKVASGPRGAVVGAVVGGIAAGLAAAGKKVAKRYVPV